MTQPPPTERKVALPRPGEQLALTFHAIDGAHELRATVRRTRDRLVWLTVTTPPRKGGRWQFRRLPAGVTIDCGEVRYRLKGGRHNRLLIEAVEAL